MKLKQLVQGAVTLATIVGSSTAFAGGPGYVFDGGGADLTFTSNALQTLAIAGVNVSAVAPATYTPPNIHLTALDDGVIWDEAGDVLSLTASGGFQLTSSTVPGAKVELSNITLDLASQIVYADAVTQSWSNALLGNYTGQSIAHLALFSGTISGQTNIVAGDGEISGSLNNLTLTSAAIPALGNALGVPVTIQNLLFPTLNFGNTALQGSFTPAVPEPSTWALSLLGLMGLTAATRRRQSA